MAMVNAPGLRDALYLVSKGIPYDVAMRLKPNRRLAMCIIFGEQDGGTWDAAAMRWREP